MALDINLRNNVVNAYTLQPYKLEEVLSAHGAIDMLYTIKAMVHKLPDGRIVYRLYRCGWDGTPNSDPNRNEVGVPQGMQMYAPADEIQEVARLLFPVLTNAFAIPDPFEYGELDTEEDND